MSPPALAGQSTNGTREGRLSCSKKSLSCLSEDSTASFTEQTNEDFCNSQSSIINYDVSLAKKLRLVQNKMIELSEILI